MRILWLSLLLGLTNARRRLPNELAFNATDFGRHLLGKNVNVPKANSPDDHLVTDLPLLDNANFETEHWAGLLPASRDGDKYLFYWLFAPPPNTKADKDIPLVIWLNGGPACSSMDGLWLENGPFRLDRNGGDWRINIADYSWHNMPAYVVYIDQPVGTGIAFTTSGKYPTNDREVNVDFYYFLKEFLTLHADKFLDGKTLSRNLFFSGESHAGHYIPSMMNYIRKQNENSPSIVIPLTGAAIGNGWVDPMVQYSAHEVAYGYSLIGRAQKRALEDKERQCQKALANGKYVNSVCFELLDDVVSNSQGKGSGYTVSQYDYRFWEQKSKPRDFPPGHNDVEAYLGGFGSISSDYTDVLKAIHSLPSLEAGQRYRECTDPPYNALKHQDGLGVTQDVVQLLNAGVKMLFFNGVNDLICNHVGNEIAVENFRWNHQMEYQVAKRYGWKSPSKGQLGGYMKEFKNLMYLKVLDSGHMVPMDVPDVSLDMMRNLVFGVSFNDYEQQLERSKQSSGENCPVCPTAVQCETCPECPSSESGENHQKDTVPSDASSATINEHPSTTITIPYVGNTAWIAFALTTLVVFACFLWICGCCRRQKARGVAVPQYDMELPSASYTDKPEEYGEIS